GRGRPPRHRGVGPRRRRARRVRRGGRRRRARRRRAPPDVDGDDRPGARRRAPRHRRPLRRVGRDRRRVLRPAGSRVGAGGGRRPDPGGRRRRGAAAPGRGARWLTRCRGGDDLVRHELCDEAVRLARLVVSLLPGDPGAEALLALLLLQDSRRAARLDAAGQLVLLEDQDRDRWDRAMIGEGLRWLARATSRRPTTAAAAAYVLQAAVAAEHARAPRWADTDWAAIVAHYDRLAALTRSPVVELNRAVAVSFADGPAAALPLLD